MITPWVLAAAVALAVLAGVVAGIVVGIHIVRVQPAPAAPPGWWTISGVLNDGSAFHRTEVGTVAMRLFPGYVKHCAWVAVADAAGVVREASPQHVKGETLEQYRATLEGVS